MEAHGCRADLSVRVPRGATGDVRRGVCDLLEDVEGVDRVEVNDLQGVRPDALDLYVDAFVTVGFDDAVESPEGQLRDGFGVLEVRVESLADCTVDVAVE
jgi:hypothetical protein